MFTRNVKANDRLIVKAAPASHYYPIDGHEVLVVNVFEHKVGKKVHTCYAFMHHEIGYGVLIDFGFQLPKGAEYKRHCDEDVFDREEVITRFVGKSKALKHISKSMTMYKDLEAGIKELGGILINHFGFTEESLSDLVG